MRATLYLLATLVAVGQGFRPSTSRPFRRGGGGGMRMEIMLEGRPISGPLKPLGNYILVKNSEAAAETAGGIVLPDQAKEKPTEGVVVSAGPGYTHVETNVLIPMPVAEGQSVLYGKFDGSKIDYDGQEHTLIRDEDILLVFEGAKMTLDAVTPAWDRILVKIEAGDEETSSGIVLAPTSGSSASASEGQVVKVGKGKVASNGELSPMPIEAGEWVKFREYAGSEVRVEGEPYVLVKASDCLAKWTE